MKLIYLLVSLLQFEYAYLAKDDNLANGKDNGNSSNGNDKPYKHMLTGKNGFTAEKFERIKTKLQKYNEIYKNKHANKHDNTTATSLLVEKLEINDFLDHKRPYQYNMETGLGDYLWNGDIVITEEFIDKKIAESEADDGRKKRQIDTDPTEVWTLPIPYYFHSSVASAAQTTFRSAVSYIQTYTCVRWQEDPNFTITGRTRIRVVDGSGCSSVVGMQSTWQEQDLTLANSGCNSMGTHIHEMTHAMGSQHEQCRYDRDVSINVDLNNCQTTKQFNYAKETTSTTTNYGMPYDFGSNMHYGPYGFCIDCTKPVMIAKDQFYQSAMGSNELMTFVDLYRINKLYNCLSTSVCPTPLACKNNGYTNPNGCNQCICPKGFGGTLCDQRAVDNNPKCGGATIQANYYWKTLSGTIDKTQNIGTTSSVPFHKCFWHITAPTGKKIEIKITSASNRCSEGCVNEGLELKFVDFRKTGYKFCCQQYWSIYPGNITESNLAIVHFYSNNAGTCSDTNTNCAGWAASGECTNNPGYMLPNCPVSCNQCKPNFSIQYRISNPDDTCYDVDTSGYCAYWAAAGECYNNPGYMLPYCAASCNTCLCYDKSSSCASWAARSPSECTANPGYMVPNCPYSCGLCGSNDCHDLNTNCAGWAAAGECVNNPGYMITNCPVSCQRCGPKNGK